MVNNIRNNTISEKDAKKGLKTLNKIKNAEIIKHRRHTPKHKELLNLFNDLLDIILTDKTLESEDKNKNENEKEESRKEENENEDDDFENEDEDENEDNDDDETMDQIKKTNK